ncbi:MAG TPA: hypothetical protein VF228_02320 [Iamia sp.]
MAEQRGDAGDEDPPDVSPPGLRWWQLVLAWVLALGSPAGIFFAGLHQVTAELSDTRPADECEGIGFGCSLSHRDGVEFLAVVYGTPVVIAVTMVFAMVAATFTVQSRWREVRWLLLVAALVIGGLTVTGRF